MTLIRKTVFIREICGLLLTRTNQRTIDLYRLLRLFAFGWRLVDRVSHFHPLRHGSESSELAVEMRSRRDQNKEVRRRAIRLIRARHRDDSTNMLHQTRLVRKLVTHSLRERLT